MKKKKSIKPTKKRKPLPRKVRIAASEALQGNQFWMRRAKHGRDALFTDPLKLLQTAQDYLSSVEESPMYRAEWKGGSLVNIPVKRVASLVGFCEFMDVPLSWWRQFKDSLTFKNNKDFSTVMEKIENKFYRQKFEGAASGFFNANIIARDLGLVDHTDVRSDDKPLMPPTIIIQKGDSPELMDDESKIMVR